MFDDMTFIWLFYSNLHFSCSLIKLVFGVAKITAIANRLSSFVFQVIINRQSRIYNKCFKLEYLFDQRCKKECIFVYRNDTYMYTYFA